MSNALQIFLSEAIPKAAVELETALLRLPEDKRNWSPMGNARTALDLVAECALLNNVTDIVTTHSFPMDFDFAAYKDARAQLIGDWDALSTLLHESAALSAQAILTVPNEDLTKEINMPWGALPLSQIISYPYWNMSYHLGQINYIASMLGCLD